MVRESTLDSSRIIFSTARELRLGRMMGSTKVNFLMAKSMGLDISFGKMTLNIRGTGRKTTFKAKAFTNGQMGVSMKETGRTT